MEYNGSEYYKEARKKGVKERNACLREGRYPYLLALDRLVNKEQRLKGKGLGLQQIPAEAIVGTVTEARTESFARNFMPILEEDTEFALKWQKLCDAHLTEGIHDPIIAYEYMNRYYVLEGNKRVSVLKAFDAVNIAASVTRIPCEATEENRIFFEAARFRDCSHLNMIEFSRTGRYLQMAEEAGLSLEKEWTVEESRKLAAVYYRFRKVYEADQGKAEASLVGDSFLALVHVYGYEEIAQQSETELKRSLLRSKEEMLLQKEEEPIEVKLVDDGAPLKETLSGWVRKLENKPLKAAFLHDGNVESSGWTFHHELGRAKVQEALGKKIETVSYFDCMQKDPSACMAKAIKEGCEVLITTSPRLLQASLRAAVEYPHVTFLNCSLNLPHRYVTSYYARMYEAKFVIGAIAGTLTKTDAIGYVADYPIYGQIAGINAFASGVQMVNPRAKIFLEWSSVGGLEEAIERLKKQGITLICSQDTVRVGDEGNCGFGLSDLSGDVEKVLAMPVIHWDTYYEKLLKSILNGTFRKEYSSSLRSLNYYWGMGEGIVDLYCSDVLPQGTKKLARFMMQAIASGVCNPFMTTVTTQEGTQAGHHEEGFSMEEIIQMDWLLENIEGSVPRYQSLTEMGQKTVDVSGVDKVVLDKKL